MLWRLGILLLVASPLHAQQLGAGAELAAKAAIRQALQFDTSFAGAREAPDTVSLGPDYLGCRWTGDVSHCQIAGSRPVVIIERFRLISSDSAEAWVTRWSNTDSAPGVSGISRLWSLRFSGGKWYATRTSGIAYHN